MKRILVLGCLVFAMVTVVSAQDEVNPGTPDTIKQLRYEAERGRADAQRRDEESDEYRRLADSARRDAQRTNDPTYKADALRNAERRDAEADRLLEEARRLRQSARAKEERADRLQKAYVAKFVVPKVVGAIPLNRPRVGDSVTGSNTSTTSSKSITAMDLVGLWDGTGYGCNGVIPVEVIKITAVGNKLTAVKVTGDACVPAGAITWEGVLEGNTISGRSQGSYGPGGAFVWVGGSATVIDKDTIQGFGPLTFRRQKASTSKLETDQTSANGTINRPRILSNPRQ